MITGSTTASVLEDVDEPVYRIDRMLTHLRLSGRMQRGPRCGHRCIEGLRERREMQVFLRDFFAPLGIPVVGNFPVGHHGDNLLMPIGRTVRLSTFDRTFTVTESAVHPMSEEVARESRPSSRRPAEPAKTRSKTCSSPMPRATASSPGRARHRDVHHSRRRGRDPQAHRFGNPRALPLEKGDFFGEMALLEALPRTADAIALTEVHVVAINGSRFDEMLRKNPEVAVRIIRKYSKRLREANHPAGKTGRTGSRRRSRRHGRHRRSPFSQSDPPPAHRSRHRHRLPVQHPATRPPSAAPIR